MDVTLRVWRQSGPRRCRRASRRTRQRASPPEASFLEMLDIVNERLTLDGEEPIVFDHDCREGICGTCGIMIDGQPHGPQLGTATCQLHMRKFNDGDTIVLGAVAGRGLSRSSRTSWSTERHSTASSKPAATSRCPPAARPTPT